MTQTLETLGEVPEAGPPGGPAGGVPRRDPERASIQSVGRALTLLETIAELGGETTLSRLASRRASEGDVLDFIGTIADLRGWR